MRLLRRVLLLGVGGWLLLSGLVYLFQRKLQYFPDGSPVALPRLDGLEDVRLETSDGVEICAWYWPGRKPLTLLIFHGNAGHRGHRLPWIQGLHERGWGVFLLDYRGYGGSDGTPTEEGLYRDGDAALDWIEQRGLKPVVYFGKSLGSGVALDLAARRPPRALIIQGGAISMVAVAKNAYPFLPVGLFMKDRFESGTKLERISCPLLSIHGEEDNIIPPRLGRELFDAFLGPKSWYGVAGAGHNDTVFVGGEAYYDRIDEFLKGLDK